MNLPGGDGRNRPCSRSGDYFSRRRNLEELLHFKGDDSGYVEGKVFMIWPPRNRLHRINLEVVEDSAIYRFEMEVPCRSEIAFRPHERVCFALRGVRVERRKESSAPHCFPIVLRFPDGIVLKYLNGANAGKVVDTWAGNADEWYDSGTIQTVSDAVTIDASEIHHYPVRTTTHPSMLITPRGDATSCQGRGVQVDRPPPSSIAVAAESTVTTRSIHLAQRRSNERPGHSVKARVQKKRRLHVKRVSTFADQPANGTDGLLLAHVATPSDEKTKTPIDNSSTVACGDHPRLLLVGGHSNGEASIPGGGDIDFLRQINYTNAMTVPPAPWLKAGVCTQRGDIFTALSDLQKGHSMINIIGIVTSVTPEKKTRTNEWSRSFTLVDPSIVDSTQQSTTVNCFQRKYLEWLPQVQKDDIVILRKVKVVEFNGVVTATGYGDKLRWAVYDPLEHLIRPPNKGDAPEKESTDDGMGYEFSPYWEPFQDSVELEYCRQIGEWWKAKRESGGQNVYTVEFPRPPRKQHLLISEASPDLPPNGFFNCTVEVLQKFNNQSGVTTVYVTDYTVNTLVHPVQATWCPPELSDRVLQCVMWDDAGSIAETMNPGEYWRLYNIRAKWNPSHYMEGTMQLAEKVTQLDETKLEAQPHLKALLARKREFGLNKSGLMSESPSLHIFPEMLLQDVDGSTSFLTCVVELLQIDPNSRDGHFIYVTDYTYNPDLPTAVATADWAYNLERRVLKIKLDDTQAKILQDLRPGSMYIIHNLRIKRSDVSGGMHGCLGGEETLIVPLHDSSGRHARSVQSNKGKWKGENMLNVLTALPDGLHGEAQSSAILESTTLQEVVAKPAPNTFRVLARAVDFFPFSPEDACVLRCTKCKTSPPLSFKRCPRCDDMVETHSKWFFRLYILLQDEKGNELIVSLSGKECMLLQDIDPSDFRYDLVTFRRFLKKVDPVLGNLRDVHMAWSRNQHKTIQSPLMIFTLESWNVDDEKGYSLLDCIPA